jgi:hypothetical protein
MSGGKNVRAGRPATPSGAREVDVPAQRGRNVVQIVRDTVEGLRGEMGGRPPEEVQAALVDRLSVALPGVEFNTDSLREHAMSIATSA